MAYSLQGAGSVAGGGNSRCHNALCKCPSHSLLEPFQESMVILCISVAVQNVSIGDTKWKGLLTCCVVAPAVHTVPPTSGYPTEWYNSSQTPTPLFSFSLGCHLERGLSVYLPSPSCSSPPTMTPSTNCLFPKWHIQKPTGPITYLGRESNPNPLAMCSGLNPMCFPIATISVAYTCS